MKKNRTLNGYTIAMAGDGDAEINMYGEVVRTRPVDFWTGKPKPGNYIAMDEFLEELDELSDKDHITVHLNSVGGDIYCGLAIYNRLKSLKAKVTTVNDSLAASAGSVIFQAGDTRKTYKGANVMIHGAACFLYGYYELRDLEKHSRGLNSSNQAMVAVYAERSGRDEASIRALVDAETWMTGEQAVEQGFADELVGEEAQVAMALSPNRTKLFCNGVALSVASLGRVPEDIPVMSAAQFETEKHINLMEGGTNMGAPNNTESQNQPVVGIETLRENHPDLVREVEQQAQSVGYEAGRQAGITEERQRLQGIEAIASAIADKDLLYAAKYGEKPLSAELLALQAMQKQAEIGVQMLGKLETDAEKSGANGVNATFNGSETEDDDRKAIAMIVGDNKKEES